MLELNQIAFIEALKKSFGNQSSAARKCGISREAHRQWLKNNPEYKAVHDAIDFDELEFEFVVDAQMKRIEEGSDTLIKNYLNTKGKHRGYGEESKLKVEGSFNLIFENDPNNEPIKD